MVMTRSLSRKRREPAVNEPRVAAAEFKATCLDLLDRVRETGVEYTVTKHGVPVARLVPYATPDKPAVLGSMAGTVLGYNRPLDPLDDEYTIDRA